MPPPTSSRARRRRCSSGRTSGPPSSHPPSGAPAASSSRSVAYRTTSSWRHARPCSPPAPTPQGRTDMFRRRGGLVRAAATTAVVAGTAGAVRHRQDQRYAQQDQERYEQDMAAQQAYAAQAAPAAPDYTAEL